MLAYRLRSLRKQQKKTQQDLANLLGISRQAYSNYETGQREPDIESLKKLADYFGVSIDFLIGHNISKIMEQAIPFDEKNMTRIPVLGTIRAGEPIDRIENIEGYELVDNDKLRGRKAFILRVQGDSMIGDNIFDGDRVVVVLQNQVEPNDIAVVAVNDDEATLKRVKFQNDMAILIPSNPDMEPMLYPADQIFIIGKVIEVRHNLE
ncbi:LexA family protein [Caenibacillus caldisaponilyticus]|uniref:LexA family protein n=1 Tax=Caenibacillus caldisaponilyticus TaxID=1674942 RepID=UPI0013015C96|nr:LexA family transcriptional regulator [Caenibacillus caldisaponilyticus]